MEKHLPIEAMSTQQHDQQYDQLNLFGGTDPVKPERITQDTVGYYYNQHRKATPTDIPVSISYGGGVNSTAMVIAMILKNERIDRIIFSDTGGEKPETYDYIEMFDNWIKSRLGFGITTVKFQDEQNRFSTLEEECLYRGYLPSRAIGKGNCSSQWKIRPMEKEVSNFCKGIGATGVISVVGIHAGEKRRLITQKGELKILQRKRYGVNFYLKYPLIEWEINQHDCLNIIQSVGLKLPSKSACFFCPNSKPSEVKDLKYNHPELYERAVQIETVGMKVITTSRKIKGLGRHYAFKDIDNQTPLEELSAEMKIDRQSCSCIED